MERTVINYLKREEKSLKTDRNSRDRGEPVLYFQKDWRSPSHVFYPYTWQSDILYALKSDSVLRKHKNEFIREVKCSIDNDGSDVGEAVLEYKELLRIVPLNEWVDSLDIL